MAPSAISVPRTRRHNEPMTFGLSRVLQPTKIPYVNCWGRVAMCFDKQHHTDCFIGHVVTMYITRIETGNRLRPTPLESCQTASSKGSKLSPSYKVSRSMDGGVDFKEWSLDLSAIVRGGVALTQIIVLNSVGVSPGVCHDRWVGTS
jgi:hypothetical protein